MSCKTPLMRIVRQKKEGEECARVESQSGEVTIRKFQIKKYNIQIYL